MNRHQRRQSRKTSIAIISDNAKAYKEMIYFRDTSYTLEQANALAIREYHLGNREAVETIYKLILAQFPSDVAAYNNLGMILKELNRYEEALENFEKAVTHNPHFTLGHINAAILLQEMNRYNEALSSCDKALASNPDNADIHNHRAILLHELRRYDEALTSYDRAVLLAPHYADAFNNRGNCLDKMHQYANALDSYEKAIALKPDYAEAYYNRAIVLQKMKCYEESLASFEKAYSLNPHIPYLPSFLFSNYMDLCKWDGLNHLRKKLIEGIEAGKPVSSPFEAAVIALSMTQQKQCAELYVRNNFPPQSAPLCNGECYLHDKIRLGYFSADFHNHPTAYLMVELFEQHDRSKFEITGFSFGPPSNDAMRKRLEKTFDHFIDVSTKSDREIALLAKDMEIDIAIDLKGFTHNSRAGIFAWRPAPVQVNYLGYPGTMGADYIDYILADSVLIPEEDRYYYTEKIAYLPDSYQVNSWRVPSDRQYTRQEVGLPEHGFVFCSFNNNYKITPDIFDIWMRLLHKLEGSVLWLLEDTPMAAANLREEAKSRGVAASRLVFAPRMELPDHLARHRIADLFLDTLPCNAHTTASDALWMGLPVLTCLGKTFAGMVAASVLGAIDLPELVASSHEEYEATALELATHPQKLSAIRQKLAQNRNSSPLFDTKLFTKNIENIYHQMWKRNQVGDAPDHLQTKRINL